MPDPIYMEKRALEFLRAWPKVPEVLRPVYSRFYDAGLIWIDPNADDDFGAWPSQLRLTEKGKILKEIVDGQSINFFRVEDINPLLPNGDLDEVSRRIFKDDIPGLRPPKVDLSGNLVAALGRLHEALDARLKLFR